MINLNGLDRHFYLPEDGSLKQIYLSGTFPGPGCCLNCGGRGCVDSLQNFLNKQTNRISFIVVDKMKLLW